MSVGKRDTVTDQSLTAALGEYVSLPPFLHHSYFYAVFVLKKCYLTVNMFDKC